MRYELHYWPGIQGRGEFVRLALEDAGADYRDVAREPGRGAGVGAMMQLMKRGGAHRVPFAPPILKAGRLVVAQTALILHYLGPRLGLVPGSEAARLWAHQLQLTVADLVSEVHDTHHPVALGLYYEDQRREAKRRTRHFLDERVPKFLDYFEATLRANGGGRRYMIGNVVTYVDLSMFQVVAGLRYAFPDTMKQYRRRYAGLAALHDRIADRPRLAAYLASPRRVAFNEDGIFRHYPELEA